MGQTCNPCLQENRLVEIALHESTKAKANISLKFKLVNMPPTIPNMRILHIK